MAELNTLPGWQCVKLLGAGSFGKVYEIKREEYNKVYKAALKVIRIPQDPSDLRRAYSEGMDRKSATNYFRSFVEDLTDEFAIMDEIKGFTNIVSYEGHWVIEHPDEIAWDILIQMELLTPLQDYCSNHTMGEEQIIRLGMDICNALEICEEKRSSTVISSRTTSLSIAAATSSSEILALPVLWKKRCPVCPKRVRTIIWLPRSTSVGRMDER